MSVTAQVRPKKVVVLITSTTSEVVVSRRRELKSLQLTKRYEFTIICHSL